MRRKDREVTDKKEIQRILETCKVCRIGLPEEDGVYIVPMNHGYCFEEEKLVLYFHGSREGKKMEMVRTNLRWGLRWTVTTSWWRGGLPASTAITFQYCREREGQRDHGAGREAFCPGAYYEASDRERL